MERKLASIQIIKDLTPIENADRIELATVLGWKVVVKIGEFKIGDKIIYVEYDSILPEKEWSEFMRPRKFRVKTAKLRNTLSQGIVFSTDILPNSKDMEIDTDVTDLLGIIKYELPAPKDQKVKGNFPSLIGKTNEIRLQSHPRLIDEIKKFPFYMTVKCDGTSGTFAKIDDEFIVCSRNWMLKPDGNNWYLDIAKKYDLENIIPNNFAIQGEVVGPGIQKNKLMLKEVDLFCFNVFNIEEQKHLDYHDFIKWCNDYGLRTVPIIKIVNPDDKFDFSLDSWLKLAEGKYEGTDNEREGIVVRPINETYSHVLNGRLSFKVINNEYLLKNNE
jgi:RNA ligase (TIGR02306 family)